jgi:hypothetical protein
MNLKSGLFLFLFFQTFASGRCVNNIIEWNKLAHAVQERTFEWVLSSDGVNDKVLDIKVEETEDSFIFTSKVEHRYMSQHTAIKQLLNADGPIDIFAEDFFKRMEVVRAQIREHFSDTENLQSALIDHVLTFATKIMQSRKKNWLPTFIEKLKSYGEKYKDNPIYITEVDKKTGEIVGSVRLIRKVYFDFRALLRGLALGKVEAFWTPDWLNEDLQGYHPIQLSEYDSRKLDYVNRYFSNLMEGGPYEHQRPPDVLFDSPSLFLMEDYLHIRLEMPSAPMDPHTPLGEFAGRLGQSFEIGALAIDKKLPLARRNKIFTNLAAKVWSYMENLGEDFPQRYRKEGQGVFVFADPLSYELFLKLNLKPFGSGPIWRDGVPWQPMRAIGEEIDEFKARIAVLKAGGMEALEARIRAQKLTP